MNRRDFTQFVALGAGSLPFVGSETHADADVTNPGADETSAAAPKQPAQPASVEPVNIADVAAIAKSKLPKATYDYVATGSADGITLRENVAAFERIRVLPPLLRGVSTADLSTTVLKQRVSMPILLAPVAVQRMYHPQGALAAARAANSAGTVFGVSSSAGNSVEEITQASKGPKWYQIYMPKDRKVARNLIKRVEAAGYKALVVTVDLGEWKDADRRNRFTLPKEMLVKHLQDIGFNVSGGMSYEELLTFNLRAWNISLS